jgi:hypothetical protein
MQPIVDKIHKFSISKNRIDGYGFSKEVLRRKANDKFSKFKYADSMKPSRQIQNFRYLYSDEFIFFYIFSRKALSFSEHDLSAQIPN